MTTTYDCLIVGGGAAGLSAALVLGRARRRTLLLDAGEPSNLAAEHVGGLLGNDRRPPADLYAIARAELREYPRVELRDGAVTALRREGDGDGDGDRGFAATLADGGSVAARRVLFATGMEYRHAELPGLAERWGVSVFHCPFCHGWEVRERPLAVLSDGEIGTHQALMLRAWTDDVTLVPGPGGVSEESSARLRAAGVRIDGRIPAALHGPGRALEAIEMTDGGELAVAGALIASRLHQRSSLAAELGVGYGEETPLCADPISVGAMYETTVPGAFAAGDVLGAPPTVAGAIAAGNYAGAAIVGAAMTG